MFSSKELKFISFVFSALSWLPLIPYNFKDGKLVMKTTKFTGVAQWFYAVIFTVHFAFFALKFPATVSDGVFIHIAIHSVYMTLISGIIVTNLNLWLYSAEIMEFVNQTLKMDQDFGFRFLNEQPPANKLRERLFFLGFIQYCFGGLTYGGLFLATSNLPFSLHFYLSRDLNINSTISFVLFLVICVLYIPDIVGVVFANFLGFACILSGIFWLKTACLELPMKDPTPTRCIFVYKSIFLLNGIFNIAFGRCMIPALKVLLGSLIVVSAYGAITFSERLEFMGVLALCVTGFVGVFSAFPAAILMSCIYDYSVGFERRMLGTIRGEAGRSRREGLLKELRGCQLIRCQVGSFYHMESQAKLTLLNSIVNGIVFMLVQQ